MDVFINDVAAFLPNQPVTNDEIEDVLGRVGNLSSRAKRLVLKNNKIERRHYAVDPVSGRLTHTNAGLAAEAIRKLKPHPLFSPSEIQCLACGTTGADLLFPGHALMVMGELGLSGCEAVSTSGICISGMTAFKYAWMNVAGGHSENAVAAGSELSSSWLRARFFTPRENPDENIEERPILGFDSDFLRWMLSDGAGAVYLSPKPRPSGISLRVEWVDQISFAGELQTCMYAGGVKNGEGLVHGWREAESIPGKEVPFLFAVKQDIKLLNAHIVPTMEKALSRTVEKRSLSPENIDWFLPHYSSAFFRDKFYEGMKRAGFEIPFEKWFTNLPYTGNTGSAAIYIILRELFHSGRLVPGQNLLCFIPESGRFSHCFMMLKVVRQGS